MRLFPFWYMSLGSLLFIAPLAFADDQVFVQVRFSVPTKYGEYQDALYYSLDDYANMKPETVENEKEARVDNYLNAVESTPPPVDPTKAELQAAKADLQAQIVVLDAKIAETP